MSATSIGDFRRKSKWEDSRLSSTRTNWQTKYKLELPRKQMLESTKFIKDYMISIRVPGWYRGISAFQQSAADNLKYAIRDDRQQRTTHRVRELLIKMGLDPIPKTRLLRQLLNICGGSDFALLWFLLDIMYNKSHSIYSVNEQIVLSSIAYLDMITTLQGLDKVLPAPQPTSKELKRMQHRKMKIRQRQKHQCKFSNQQQCKKKYIMPYFEKPVLPELLKPNLMGYKPEYKSYIEFKAKLDPVTAAEEERMRWFKDYKFSPKEHLVRGIIKDQIDYIFKIFESANIDENIVTALCQHHQQIEQIKNSFENQLKELEEQRAKNIYDETYRKQRNYKRIMKRFYDEIEKQRNEFRKTSDSYRQGYITKVLSMEPNEEVDPEDPIKTLFKLSNNSKSFTLQPNHHFHQESSEILGEMSSTTCCCRLLGDTPEMQTIQNCNLERNVSQQRQHHNKDCGCILGYGEDCMKLQKTIQTNSTINHDTVKSSEKLSNQKRCSCKMPVLKSSVMDFRDRYVNDDDDLEEEVVSSSSSKYFEPPAKHKPYQFNYQKIFAFKSNSKECLRIRKAFVEAVDSDIALLNKLRDQSSDGRDTRKILHKAIERNCEKIWKGEVENHEAMLNKNKKSDSPLNYRLSYYDPNDDELMTQMLKDGLDYLKQDPKYVLASLPEAHHLPILKEWIRLRYGKTYKPQELAQIFKSSLPIFRALSNVALSIKLPPTQRLGAFKFISYNCRNHLKKKAQYVREMHYKRMNDVLLQQARIFYFAMRPDVCTSIQPNDVFFAYIPSNKYQIYNFRPWQKQECKCNVSSKKKSFSKHQMDSK